MDKGGMVFRKRYRDRKTRGMRTCSTWTIRYYGQSGKQHEESGWKTESQARKLLRKRLADKDQGLPIGPEVGRVTFTQAVDDVIADYRVTNRRSLVHLQRRVKLHLAPFFGNRWLVTITTADCRAYTVHRQSEGASLGSVRLELSIVKRAFRLAMQANRVSRVPYIPMPAPSTPREGFFEDEHVRAVLAHLPADIQPIVQFAFLTGWRKGEILGLQWRNVDLKAGEVRLEPGTTKNRQGRMIKLAPGSALKRLLDDQQTATKTLQAKRQQIVPWVFPDAAGDRRKDLPWGAWHRACRAAGCPGRTFHDFRRTVVRNLVNRAGVSERVAMMMTGHKTRAVFDRYHIVNATDVQEASVKYATVIDTVIAGTPEAAKSSNATQATFGNTLRKSANSARSATR